MFRFVLSGLRYLDLINDSLNELEGVRDLVRTKSDTLQVRQGSRLREYFLNVPRCIIWFTLLGSVAIPVIQATGRLEFLGLFVVG
jgi:hypothetical protein